MSLLDIQNKFEKIIKTSIWSRIFHWSKVTNLIGELQMLIQTSLRHHEQLSEKINILDNKMTELEIAYKTEQKLKEKSDNEIVILKNKIELLAPLKVKNIELNTELNKMKQEENSKDLERDAVITKYEQFENNAREREQKKTQLEEEKLQDELNKLKRTWQDHETYVNSTIKVICQEEAITFVDEWHHEKKPDNVIKICNEYIVFDAKSPSKDELDHFPKYINTEAGKLSKYADHKDVKKHLFLVVPQNAIHALKKFTYHDSNYCVHVIPPQALKITMWSLKQIELYEFAEKLSPEDRENLARAFAGSMNYIKRMIQINSDMNDSGIQLTEQMMKLISRDSLKSIKEQALEYEKGDLVNPSQQKRGKIIDLKTENLRHKDLKSKAQNHEIISTSKNKKKQIDSK